MPALPPASAAGAPWGNSGVGPAVPVSRWLHRRSRSCGMDNEGELPSAAIRQGCTEQGSWELPVPGRPGRLTPACLGSALLAVGRAVPCCQPDWWTPTGVSLPALPPPGRLPLLCVSQGLEGPPGSPRSPEHVYSSGDGLLQSLVFKVLFSLGPPWFFAFCLSFERPSRSFIPGFPPRSAGAAADRPVSSSSGSQRSLGMATHLGGTWAFTGLQPVGPGICSTHQTWCFAPQNCAEKGPGQL